MESYLQTGNGVTVTFKPAGWPPAPSLFAQRWLGRAREPLRPPRARPRAASGDRVWRARRLAARGARGGQRIPAPGRVSHFLSRGGNNKQSGAAAGAPLAHSAPCAQHPSGRGPRAAAATPALRPGPPRPDAKWRSCPRALALRAVLSHRQGPPPKRPRRSAGRPRGREVRRPFPPGGPRGQGRRSVPSASPSTSLSSQSLCAK